MGSVAQPSGTVTLVFTDIEGSTRLLAELGEARYLDVLSEHREVVRGAFGPSGGYEVDTQGDSFFYVFPSAAGAVRAVGEAMAALEGGPIAIRVGVHTGEPGLDGRNYVGLDVHTAARIMAAGHGGQVVLSQSTRDLLDDSFTLSDLGEHRLKDLSGLRRLYQLGADEFPPLKTLNNTNLPVPASSFIGRERELAEVSSLLLRDGGGRLVTLTGPGGSGKTRLAIEAATEVVGDYRDGVFWVGLASLSESALVVETIAQTLGARDGLAEQIGSRALLLILDNFEHVIAAAADLSALLGACRNLRLLVTSRELLRLQGEVEYPVPPLAKAEAEELFCARSRLPRDEEIADLCRQLDDLPLALELAAARTAVLSPAQIRARLAQRLDLFKGGRDAEPRQRTLRTTIEWSYELLSEPERLLYARLAVFAGGCTLEAAEEVVAADVDGLQSLVEKSLLRRSGGRFWMLETIGELARERLHGSDGAGEIARRHADYFLALAEQAEPAIKGAEQPAWLQRLEDDHDNLRSSLEWFLEHGEPELGLRLAGALWIFWHSHGHIDEARRWLRRALDAAPDEPSEARSKALDGAGFLALLQGDADDAIGLLETALVFARAVGASSVAALAAAHLCAARIEFDPRAAVASGEEAVALAHEAGGDYGLMIALNNLGHAIYALGEIERASAHFEESLVIRRRVGDPSRLAVSLARVGEMALVHGDLSRAAALYTEASEIATAIGDKASLGWALAGLAWLAYHERRWEEADAQARKGLQLARELGMKPDIADWLFCLAAIAAATGDVMRAARLAAAAELQKSPPGLTAAAGLYQSSIESAKAPCDPETWERAWAAGQAMNLDEAAQYALS